MTDRTPNASSTALPGLPGAPVGPAAARTSAPDEGIRRLGDPLASRCRGGILLRSHGPPVSPAEPQRRGDPAARHVLGDEASRAA